MKTRAAYYRYGTMLFACAFAAACAGFAAEPGVARVRSCELAPIGNPYFFMWWNAPAPSHAHFNKDRLPRHQTVNYVAARQDRDWWLDRGVWPFGWSWGTQEDAPFHSADEYAAYMAGHIGRGAPGICFDEWVNSDGKNPKNALLAEACRRVKAAHPDFFIGAFTHMQSAALVEALKEGWVDLAIIESYPHVAGEPAWTPELALWRLGLAKKAGVLEQTIPALWIQPEDRTFSAAWLERWLKRFRKDFPQMPGLAPLFPDGHDTADPRTLELTRVCDELRHNYYVEPAPRVEILEPANGATVETGTIEVVARADQPVQRWELYRDAERVAVRRDTKEGALHRFGNIQAAAGRRVLTLHAVSPDWHRSAAQVSVRVVPLEKP